MPYEVTDGIGGGCIVENEGCPLTVHVGPSLLGKTLDGLGRLPDGSFPQGMEYPVEAPPPDPMAREIIDTVLPLGVKAVDGLITVGKGQRIGIFAGSGVGKSTLMGMFARNTKADINVIALIGERGREVREFIERDLGEEECGVRSLLWRLPINRRWNVIKLPRRLRRSQSISAIRERMSF